MTETSSVLYSIGDFFMKALDAMHIELMFLVVLASGWAIGKLIGFWVKVPGGKPFGSKKSYVPRDNVERSWEQLHNFTKHSVPK